MIQCYMSATCVLKVQLLHQGSAAMIDEFGSAFHSQQLHQQGILLGSAQNILQGPEADIWNAQWASFVFLLHSPQERD